MAGFISRPIKIPAAGKNASDYAVRDIVKIPVNGTVAEFIVVHQGNPNSTIYDASCNGTWLLMKDIYNESVWNANSQNDYENGAIHSYLNGDFYNLLNDATKTAAIQVKIPYRAGYGTNPNVSNLENGLSAKVFLLSGAEVGLSYEDYYLPYSEGVRLSYFSSGITDTAKAKRVAKLNGVAAQWWLRSPHVDSSASAFYIATDGTMTQNGVGARYGVRPALVIAFNTKFNSHTNVIRG